MFNNLARMTLITNQVWNLRKSSNLKFRSKTTPRKKEETRTSPSKRKGFSEELSKVREVLI